ncbi:MAG TPA: FtsX-like permease family protein [Desulfobulbaceae bacterium]|nr:FtsX-like permease family protein [Desulfobulbaceae bacterium]HHD62935.1 FtsX-like permease family protein [Desulfobulbaceae bacterium]
MRLLKILEFALSSLGRRKFKNFSIIVVYSLTITALASVLLLTSSLKKTALNVLVDGPNIVVQRLAGGRHDLIPTDYARIIEKIPGVGRVKPRIWGYYYDSLYHANYTILGIDRGSEQFAMVEGKTPAGDEQCMVGQGVAEAQHAEPGMDLLLINSKGIGYSCEISGTFKAKSALWTNDLIVFTTGALKRFFTMPDGLATDITVEVFNAGEVALVAQKIKRLLPDTRPITIDEILHTYESIFNWRSGMMLTIFTSSLLAFSILAWDKATGISREEKREIGILKAIGWDTGDVLTLKLCEGAVISVTAFLIGISLAYIHVFLLNAPLLVPVLKGWSVLFPRFHPVPYIDGYQIIILGFLTIVPYMASTVLPSWKAAITDPENAMRGV